MHAMSTSQESEALKGIVAAAIIPGLRMLLIASVFSSFLVPTSVVLFVFSTPVLRRRPYFILNLCAIALGLTQGIIFIYTTVSGHPFSPHYATQRFRATGRTVRT